MSQMFNSVLCVQGPIYTAVRLSTCDTAAFREINSLMVGLFCVGGVIPNRIYSVSPQDEIQTGMLQLLLEGDVPPSRGFVFLAVCAQLNCSFNSARKERGSLPGLGPVLWAS